MTSPFYKTIVNFFNSACLYAMVYGLSFAVRIDFYCFGYLLFAAFFYILYFSFTIFSLFITSLSIFMNFLFWKRRLDRTLFPFLFLLGSVFLFVINRLASRRFSSLIHVWMVARHHAPLSLCLVILFLLCVCFFEKNSACKSFPSQRSLPNVIKRKHF